MSDRKPPLTATPENPVTMWRVCEKHNGLPLIYECTWNGQKNRNGQASLQVTDAAYYARHNGRSTSSRGMLGLIGHDTFGSLEEAVTAARAMGERTLARLRREVEETERHMETEVAFALQGMAP